MSEELEALMDLIDNAENVQVCTFDPMRCEHKRVYLSDDNIAQLGNGLAAIHRLAAAGEQKPVAWQWNYLGSWFTVDSHSVEDPERYARSFGYPVRPIYTTAPQPAQGWDENPLRKFVQNLDCECDSYHGFTCGRCVALRSSQSTSYAGGGVREALSEMCEMLNDLCPNEDIGAYNGHGEWIELCSVREFRALSNPAAADSQPATLTYTNYRGETSVRSVIPKSVRYGSTEWHPEPQWLLLAYDTEKKADREFALKDFGPPAAADSNASAEARLREALKKIQCLCNRTDSSVELLADIFDVTNFALSPDRHASDCEKQGETTKSEGGVEGHTRLIDDPKLTEKQHREGYGPAGSESAQPVGSTTKAVAGIKPGPSDRPADVTVEDLAYSIALKANPALLDWETELAVELLDAFTVGRR